MARRPIKTKDWIRFIVAHGCKYKRTKASHVYYQCPNCFRPITHREKGKDIPPMHLASNLKTMGKTLDYLYQWLKDN